MVNLTYLCKICNIAEFPLDHLKEAKEHCKIPLNEGGFEGTLLKELHAGSKDFYNILLLIKSDKISAEHERIYEALRATGISDSLLDKHYNMFLEEKDMPYPLFKQLLSGKKLSKDVSEIKEKIENGEWIGFNQEDFSKLVKLLKFQNTPGNYPGGTIENYKTI